MKLQSHFFRRGRLFSAFAGLLLLISPGCANAQDCEPLTATAGSPPPGLVTYQLPDLSGIDLLGRDGSRVRSNTAAPSPTLTRTGAEVPAPSLHWTNLADLAVYNDAQGENRYLLSTQSGGFRLCRIEHNNRHGRTMERFEYDTAGRLTGWQMLFAGDGEWKVSDHRCFHYGAGGLLTSYASAPEFVDCRHPKPEHVQAYYLRGDAGKLTRVIKFGPTLRAEKPNITVILFDGQGTATHFILHDWGGGLVQFPVLAENLDEVYIPRNFITVKSRHFEIALTDNGLAESNSPWEIVLGEADASADDYLTQSKNVRVFAKGTTDGEGRVLLSPVRKRLLWSFVNAHPDRACLMFYSHCISIRTVYPEDEWARCIDPAQRDPEACHAH
jgi:hypothetical protein